MSKDSQAGFSSIVIMVVLLIGLIAGVFIVQTRTTFKPRAQFEDISSEYQQFAQGQEENFDKTGKLKILHVDDFKNKKSQTKYLLASEGDEYILDTKGKRIGLAGGSTIRVRGTKKGIVVSPIRELPRDFVRVMEGLPLKTTGEFKVGIVKVVVQNGSLKTRPESEYPTDASLLEMLGSNGTIDKYYQENSYNNISFKGEIVGTFTVDNAEKAEGCDYEKPVTDKIDKQIGEDILSRYTNVMYILPVQKGCGAGGIGTIMVDPDDGLMRTWILSQYNDPSLYAHELGHNLGLHHAAQLSCDYFPGCRYYEYGDMYDVLGGGNGVDLHQFNAPHKIAMGWIKQSLPNFPIQEINPGREKVSFVSISPLETRDGATKVVKVFRRNMNPTIAWVEFVNATPNTTASPDPTGEVPVTEIAENKEYFYLSYRQPIGTDKNLGPEITSGASVHLWNDDPFSITRLIYQVPRQSNEPFPTSQVGDPVFIPGGGNQDRSKEIFYISLCDGADCQNNVFEDKEYGIRITQISHNKDSVNLKIEYTKDSVYPSPSSFPTF